jgi:hypothetical protein
MTNRTTFASYAALLAGMFLTGCVDDAEYVVAPGEEPQSVELSATDQLLRASMTLRGLRPSIAELELVADDPSAMSAIVDAYLASPSFGKVIRDLHNESLLVRTDYAFYPAGFPRLDNMQMYDAYYLNTSVQEASLRLVEHVVMNDLPYSQIVTADYAIANHVVSTVWGTTYDTTGAEWQQSYYQDGRPVAGVLSDPWVFTRHASTISNANRGRANAMSKALLCYDFLDRDIVIDSSINLADPDVVNNAVVENEACAACHQTLDPLASFFQDYFPIFVAQQIETYPYDQFYYPGIFQIAGVEMRDPGYFGQAGNNVADLGRLMADDPRLSLCAVQRFYAYFHQVPLDEVPLLASAELQQEFIQSGLNAKVLAKAIVMSDAFKLSHSGDEVESENLAGIRKIRPDQMSTMFLDLTGFKWEVDLGAGGGLDLGRAELTTDSMLGFEVLGGGIDAAYVTRPTHTFNATASLVLQTMAAEAAAYVVDRDFAEADPQKRHLLKLVELDGIDPKTAREQIAWLHLRLLGEVVEVDSDEVTESWELFSAGFQHNNNIARAWELLLTAMMQDIRIATY